MRTLSNYMRIALAAVALVAATTGVASAQDKPTKKLSRKEYIEHFAPLAVEQQTLYGIPASITLAQGVLESGNGNSRLAKEGNNHFGIKCGGTWDGPSLRHDDDAPQECFRSYASAEESYIDHSLFLSERPWYRSLFSLAPTDYKGWAHGLKAAGYATDPKYAYKLIEIIETYELYKYDTALLADYVAPEALSSELVAQPDDEFLAGHEAPQQVDVDALSLPLYRAGDYGIYADERGRYVLCSEGDHINRVAKAVGVSAKNLRRFNSLDKNASLASLQRIYIEKPL